MSDVVKNNSLDDARKQLLEDRSNRETACGEELTTLLKKYNCRLVFVQKLVNGLAEEPAAIAVVAQ